MSVSFNILTPLLEGFTGTQLVNEALQVSLSFFQGVTTGFERFFQKNSTSNVFDRLKKNGSVVIHQAIKENIILVEFGKDEVGCGYFVVVDTSYKPVIIREKVGAHQIFEVQVMSILSKLLKGSESLSFGASSRWKADQFEVLTNRFITQKNNAVFLKLPQKKMLKFETRLEAESVLRHYYQTRKTPFEESNNWGRIIFAVSALFLTSTSKSDQITPPALFLTTLAATHYSKWALAASIIATVKPVFAEQVNAITLLNPQPDVWIKPYKQYESIINLNQDYKCSNPNQNLHLSLQNANGSPLPDGISLTMGPLSKIISEVLETDIIDKALYINVVDDMAYIVGQKYFYALNISNRARPVILGSVAHQTWGVGLSITNKTAYVMSLLSTSLGTAIDVSIPTKLNVIGFLQPAPPGGSQYTLSVISNNTLYSVGTYNITKFDIYNQVQLRAVKTGAATCIADPQFTAGISVIEGIIFCAYTIRLHAYDANSLQQVFNIQFESAVTSFAGNKKLLCVGVGQYAFIYNNLNQTNPDRIKGVYLGNQATVIKMFITDDYLYCACKGAGVVVVDIRNPQNAEVVIAFSTFGEPMDAVLVGNDLCLADGPAGFTRLSADSRIIAMQTGQLGQNNINITAKDDLGHSLTYTEIMTIGDQAIPPTVLFPLESTSIDINTQLEKLIPQDTFSGSNLTLSAQLSNGKRFPTWLKFKVTESIASFSGTPSSFDVDTFSGTTVLDIDVFATNSAGVAKTGFKVSIVGQSFWANLIYYGGSISLTLYGILKKKAAFWNWLNKDNYTSEIIYTYVGDEFKYELTLEPHQIQKIEIYKNNYPLFSDLCPEWLRKLEGKPTSQDVGRYIINIYNHKGYRDIRFVLIVKDSSSAKDPELERVPTYREEIKEEIAEIWKHFFSREKNGNISLHRRSGTHPLLDES